MFENNSYQEYNLYITAKEFIIDPLENEYELLIIDRISNEINIKKGEKLIPQNYEKTFKIYGILGTIQLLAGNYLIVITARKYVGEIGNHIIWQADSYEILPYCKSYFHLTEQKAQDNKIYVTMLRHIMTFSRFYYSNSYDLTHTMQYLHTHKNDSDFYSKSIFERSDNRFTWNRYLMREFSDRPQLKAYMTPLMCGFISISRIPLTYFGHPPIVSSATSTGNNLESPVSSSQNLLATTASATSHLKDANPLNYLSFGIVSRRSIHRAGVRYYTRGLDEDGHPANYIETEQFVISPDFSVSSSTDATITNQASTDTKIHPIFNRASYVQTRGSVPLFWSQEPNLRYKPLSVLSTTQDQATGFRKHMARQIHLYGKQVIINLLDKIGAEGDLSRAFEKTISEGPSDMIKYFQFDFHKECANLQFDRLDRLLEAVGQEQNSIRFFLESPVKNMLELQNGVFRTNCADSLDRTNVVQTILAKQILERQLKIFDVITEDATLDLFPEFFTIFRNVWTENANACSWQYAGSKALKTDFTRTGKRTKFGLIQDGLNSALRYYKNNFVDGFSQDSIYLFLGKFIVDTSNEYPYVSPFKTDTKRDWKYLGIPIVFIISFSMMVITFLIPSPNYADQMIYYSFWAMVSCIALFFIFTNGPLFVDKPRLSAPRIKNE